MTKRDQITFFILFLIIFGGAIFWYLRGTICERGVTYTITSIDESYDLEEVELISIIDDAANIWEEEIGYPVFTHTNNDADVEVNLIFDERQESTLRERDAREALENKEDSIESIQESLKRDSREIDRIKSEFTALQRSYESEKQRLAGLRGNPEQYNTQVARVNSLVSQISSKQAQLNNLITSYNARVSDADKKVKDFNNTVGLYNNNYAGEGESFDKGDYGSGVLNLYQYEDRGDLVLLVAHELGHVLGIGHVENSRSIMHFSLEDQNSKRITLTDEDKAALVSVCEA